MLTSRCQDGLLIKYNIDYQNKQLVKLDEY